MTGSKATYGNLGTREIVQTARRRTQEMEGQWHRLVQVGHGLRKLLRRPSVYVHQLM